MDRDFDMAMDEMRRIKLRKPEAPVLAGDKSPFLSLRQVLELVPVSRSCLYRMIAEGEFPKQKQLGRRRIAWSREEVNAWIQARLDA